VRGTVGACTTRRSVSRAVLIAGVAAPLKAKVACASGDVSQPSGSSRTMCVARPCGGVAVAATKRGRVETRDARYVREIFMASSRID